MRFFSRNDDCFSMVNCLNPNWGNYSGLDYIYDNSGSVHNSVNSGQHKIRVFAQIFTFVAKPVIA